ncbi:MAG: hypothetical protein WA637_22920 [Terriglobales bacterium]
MTMSTQRQPFLISVNPANNTIMFPRCLDGATTKINVVVLCLAAFILMVAPLRAAQAQTATKDPKAISVLMSAIEAAGGVETVGALKDMSASGSISYFWAGKEVVGSVAIKGLGIDRFRFDATLPDGSLSWVVRGTTGFARDQNGKVSQFPLHKALSADNLMFFIPRLVLWVTDPNIGVLYMGTTSFQGALVHHISIQRTPPAQLAGTTTARLSQVMSKDLYIDSTSSLITRIEDQIYPVGTVTDPLPHSVVFSDYRTVNGIVLPFSADEQIDGVTVSRLALDVVLFNTGLTDSAFN